MLRTESGDAFLSADAGDTWRNLAEILTSQGYIERFHAEQVHVSHAEPRHVAVLTDTAIVWLSEDGGAKWRPVTLGTAAQGRRTASWQWHPTLKGWALAQSAAASRGQALAPAFYTKDAGSTWTLLAADAVHCFWHAAPGADARRLLLVRRPEGARAGGASGAGGLALEVLAGEGLATREVLLGEGAPAGAPPARRVIVRSGLVLEVSWGEGTAPGSQLWRLGTDGKGAPRFRPLSWPANAAPARRRQLRGLAVLHAAGGSALLFVPAEDPSLPWGHVFACGPDSSELELVLTDLQRPQGALGGAAWQAVNGIEGIFIANRAVLDKGQDLDVAEGRYDSQAEAIEGGADGPGLVDEASGSDSSVTASPQQFFAVRTYISVDMGQAWQPLAVLGQGTGSGTVAGCDRPRACSLHLAHWSSCMMAPGVLVGVGNVGVRLAEDASHHSVFVSRDAGLGWRSVLEGSHVVSFLGHGDALVAVPVASPGTLLYSTNTGGTWEKVSMVAQSDKALAVQGLFAHPMHADWQAFAALSSDGTHGLKLVGLDLSKVLSRDCDPPKDAASASSDFETWSPADALEDVHESKRPVCLWGVRSHYLRRKPDRQCQTGRVRSKSLFDVRLDTSCQCSASDWACDAGFHRTAYTAGAPCEPIEGAMPNATALCAATTASHVMVTRGYAKPPGNRCQGGLDLSPRTEPCPRNAGFLGALRRAVPRPRLTVGLLVVVALLAGFLVRRRRAEASGSKPCHGGATALGRAALQADDEDEERTLLLDRTPR